MTARSEPLSTIWEIPDDIRGQIHLVIQRRDTAGLHRALACSATRSASTPARRRPAASPRTDHLPVMINSVAWRPSDSLDRVRRRPPTKTCQPLGPTRSTSGSPATGYRLPASLELQLGRGCPVYYQSPRGFIQKRNWNRPSRTARRPEDSPLGKVSELYFGQLILIRDPKTGRRRTAGRLSLCWAIPGAASSGPPSVRRCRT